MTYNPHSPENARVEDAVEEATLAVLNQIDQAIQDNWAEFVANVLDAARTYAGVYDDPDALFDPEVLGTGQDVYRHLLYLTGQDVYWHLLHLKRELASTGR